MQRIPSSYSGTQRDKMRRRKDYLEIMKSRSALPTRQGGFQMVDHPGTGVPEGNVIYVPNKSSQSSVEPDDNDSLSTLSEDHSRLQHKSSSHRPLYHMKQHQDALARSRSSSRRSVPTYLSAPSMAITNSSFSTVSRQDPDQRTKPRSYHSSKSHRRSTRSKPKAKMTPEEKEKADEELQRSKMQLKVMAARFQELSERYAEPEPEDDIFLTFLEEHYLSVTESERGESHREKSRDSRETRGSRKSQRRRENV